MRETILKFLLQNPETYFSGEQMAKALGRDARGHLEAHQRAEKDGLCAREQTQPRIPPG